MEKIEKQNSSNDVEETNRMTKEQKFVISIYPTAIDRLERYEFGAVWKVLFYDTTRKSKKWNHLVIGWTVIGRGVTVDEAWKDAWEFCQQKMLERLEQS